MLPALALRPTGHRVLDLCAAPGGKSLALLDAMATPAGAAAGGDAPGVLVSNDVQRDRRDRTRCAARARWRARSSRRRATPPRFRAVARACRPGGATEALVRPRAVRTCRATARARCASRPKSGASGACAPGSATTRRSSRSCAAASPSSAPAAPSCTRRARSIRSRTRPSCSRRSPPTLRSSSSRPTTLLTRRRCGTCAGRRRAAGGWRTRILTRRTARCLTVGRMCPRRYARPTAATAWPFTRRCSRRPQTTTRRSTGACGCPTDDDCGGFFVAVLRRRGRRGGVGRRPGG